MVFAERRGRVVLAGGLDGTFLSDVWEWDGTSCGNDPRETRESDRGRRGRARHVHQRLLKIA
jgi:hypothetical protein